MLIRFNKKKVGIFLKQEEQKLRTALVSQSPLTQLVLSALENALPVLKENPSLSFSSSEN